MRRKEGLEKTLRCVEITNSLNGLQIIEFPWNRPRVLLSVIYAFIIYALWEILFYYLPMNRYDQPDDAVPDTSFQRMFSDLTTRMLLVTILIYSGLGLYYTHLYKTCLKRITMVDETLEALGSPTNYKTLKLYANSSLIIWIILVFLVTCASAVWLLPELDFLLAVQTSIFYMRCLLASGLLNMTFCITVASLYSRFVRLNELLENALFKSQNVKENATCLELNTPTSIFKIRRLLQTTKQMHLELRRVGDQLSICFGIQMSIEMATSILVITALLFDLYRTYIPLSDSVYKNIGNVLISLLLVIIYLSKIFFIDMICRMTTNEASRTLEVIHNVNEIVEDDETKDEIWQFTLQIKWKPLQFTAFNFFPLDCNLIRGVLGTITTYLLILIQMN